ncbi:MAG: squalene synthase HpnC [Proteobacteria bacterium]|nr:squalene synthase HpnC [Pseudomonadota bacterium]MBS0434228.1 squalene synthase HpnC [Pseudomonadota bacterium]
MSAAGTRPVDHYENFPVASWLCPPRLRAPIAAIYHFARTADDLADEGDAPAARRLADLSAYREDLHAIARGAQPAPRWAAVFQPLAAQIRAFALPVQPLHDLLSAFEQDVAKTERGAAYADWPELLDYCRRSANPVGRLLLHLYGVTEAQALAESDAICTALQLINFWQDLSVDIPRGRYYLPLAECAAHGLAISDPATQFAALQPDEKTTELIAACARQTSAGMQKGLQLVHRVPGRAGWELRAVAQGGLRVLERAEALGAQVLRQRPRLRAGDAPVIAWRMLRM